LACECKESATFVGKLLDKLEQFYAYFSTAGEDMRFFGFFDTAPVVRARLDTVAGLPEGSRVLHPTNGAGFVERIDEHDKLGPITVKFDNGEVLQYSLISAAELKGVSKRSAFAAAKSANDEMIAISVASKLKGKSKLRHKASAVAPEVSSKEVIPLGFVQEDEAGARQTGL
jgi:hypothetical protein